MFYSRNRDQVADGQEQQGVYYMELQGYKCNQCGLGFEEIDTKPDITCIECGSSDIQQSDKVSEFLELIREMGRTGG